MLIMQPHMDKSVAFSVAANESINIVNTGVAFPISLVLETDE